MRPNRRARILEVAKEHLAEHGPTSIRLERVAVDSGMTIQGLRYHFRTVEDLALAVIESVAARWRAALERVLRRPLHEAQPADRIRAHNAALLCGELDADDFLVVLHVVRTPELEALWRPRVSRWLELPADMDTPTRLRLLHAQVLAEGLFARFATGVDRENPDHAALARLALGLPQG